MSFGTRYNRNRGASVRAKAVRTTDWVFWTNAALIAAAVSLFVGYLAMNNTAATKGFAIRSVESRISELRDEARRLDLEVVSMQSMESIGENVGTLGFVTVESVDYLNSGPAVVAVK